MLYKYIIQWKKRWDDEESEYIIRELIKSLTAMHLIAIDYSKDYKSDFFML